MLPEQLVTDTIEIVAELLDADETTLTADSALAGIWPPVHVSMVPPQRKPSSLPEPVPSPKRSYQH